MTKAVETAGIDRYFVRNTASISAAEFLWGIGLPVLIETTFLQIFLTRMGASDFVLGMIPSIFSISMALCAPLATLLTSHLNNKKTAVFTAHTLTAIPILVYGLTLPFIDAGSSVVIFLLIYGLFSAGIGVTLPLWQNFLVQIFSKKNTIRGLSVMFIFQTIARIVSAFAIAGVVEKYALSIKSSAAVFTGAGIVIFAGSFFFLFVKEGRKKTEQARRHNLISLVRAMKDIIQHKNFVFFVFSTLESTACITVVAFYAKFAVQHRGISESYAAGLFTAALFSGAIIAQIIFGWLDVFAMKVKFIVSKLCASAGIVLIIFSQHACLFILASIFLGISRGVFMIAYSPAVKELSGKEDATDYFSATPLFMLPFAFFVPYLSGFFIEGMENTLFSNQAMFGVMFFITIISIAMLLPVRFFEKEK